MLTLSNLKPKNKRQRRKRRGRGDTYAGRGLKGQKARSGGNIRPGFEGGRMPLVRQIPKARGFKSIHKKAQVVNLADLEKKFATHEVVSPKTLQAKGLIKDAKHPVKILGQGKLSKPLEFKDVKLSKAVSEIYDKKTG